MRIYNGQFSTSHDQSNTSMLGTSVVVWYHGVKHEVEPVTSGYRFMLVYDLFHTTAHPQPSLPSHSTLINRLSNILTAWKDDKTYKSPDKLIYLFNIHYDREDLDLDSLVGEDSRRVAILEDLAKKHGFRIGLADTKVFLSGRVGDVGYQREQRRLADDYECGSDPDRCSVTESDDDVDDPEELEFVDSEVDSWSMEVEHLVDLQGDLIAEELEFDDRKETIPENIIDYMKDDIHDKQEYHKDTYRVSMLLYRNSMC